LTSIRATVSNDLALSRLWLNRVSLGGNIFGEKRPMPSPAVELKYLRRILAGNADTFLSICGMTFYHDRIFYQYADEAIYFVSVGHSGGFRGEHWKALSCAINIHYKNFPGRSKPPLHSSGNPIPNGRHALLSFFLERTIDQSQIIDALQKPSLHFDRNFWHVLDDESNLGEVLHDIACVVRDQGLPLVMKPVYSRSAMLAKRT
jgi:hypothetical protein